MQLAGDVCDKGCLLRTSFADPATMELNWKALYKPKSVLKVIEMMAAVVALALVAGFSVESTSVCDDPSGTLYPTVTLSTDFPFRRFTESYTDNHTGIRTERETDFDEKGISQAAVFFVAWGALSVVYGVTAVVVYVLVTANGNERQEKVRDFLVYVDLIFHVVWAACWLIASAEWVFGYHSLQDAIQDEIDVLAQRCFPDPSLSSSTGNDNSDYVQALIAGVIGVSSFILWSFNIFWVLIDTRLCGKYWTRFAPRATLELPTISMEHTIPHKTLTEEST